MKHRVRDLHTGHIANDREEEADRRVFAPGTAQEHLGLPSKAIEALEASLRENPSNEDARAQLERLRGGAQQP